MKRVLVLGSPGSGKSTFSRKLSKKTGLPNCYLDQLFWNADKTTVSREIFEKRLDKELTKATWIMDGNYSFTLKKRLEYCDTIFLLDYPTEVCLDGVRNRIGKVVLTCHGSKNRLIRSLWIILKILELNNCHKK